MTDEQDSNQDLDAPRPPGGPQRTDAPDGPETPGEAAADPGPGTERVTKPDSGPPPEPTGPEPGQSQEQREVQQENAETSLDQPSQ